MTVTDEWRTGHEPGVCTWPAHCGLLPPGEKRQTTHVVEWPQGWIDTAPRFRTYACAEDAERIVNHQNTSEVAVERCGPVRMREVGEGNW